MVVGLRFDFLPPDSLTLSPLHDAARLDLFHPFQLAQVFKFVEQRHPGAGHVRVHFAKTSLTDASAWAVTHELRTFGLEGAIRNWRPLMDTSHVLVAMFFARDKDSYWHDVAGILMTLSDNLYPLRRRTATELSLVFQWSSAQKLRVQAHLGPWT